MKLGLWLAAALTGVTACAAPHNAVPTSSTESVPASAGASASGAESGGTGTPGGPVPAGFVASDLTFVSTTQGFLLGTAPCASAPCTSIVHTTDGGRTWAGVPAPRATLEADGQNGCTGRPCVRGLRFGNPLTGYAYGSSSLYITRDGGRTWRALSGQADALEIGDGTVIRVSSSSKGCPPGCLYTLSWSMLGSTAFTPAVVNGSMHLIGNNVQLLRTGSRAFAELFGNPAGGAEDAHAVLLTSGDDGRTWTTRSDPCATYKGAEADSVQLAVADDASVSILCRSRVQRGDFVITSTDGGATFGPQRAAPADAEAIGAASAQGLLVETRAGHTATLWRSGNGGSSWARVTTAAVSNPDDGALVAIGFENSTTGRWTPGGPEVLTTTDAGRTWAAYTFAG